MIKRKLSSQLIFIYALVIIVLTITFSIFLNNKLNDMYITENYNRIEQILNNYSESNSIGYLPDDVLIVSKKTNDSNIEIKNNVYNFSNNYINNIFNEISTEFPTRLEKTYDHTTYYFIGYKVNNTKYFVCTDSSYITSRISENIIQIVLIFIVILVLGILVINAYSRQIVNRILFVKNKLHSKEIIDNFEEKYFDDEITDLTRSLFKMKNEISHQEKIKEEMLQSISHDFKTPIAVIKSYSEAIKDGIVSVDDIDVILKQTDILNKKVYQLLEITKLEYLSNQDLTIEPVNIKDIIDNLYPNFLLMNSNIKLDINLDDCYLNGIYENYYTVFENLLDNAFRYAKSLIKIESFDGGIRVYNDGPNINPEVIEKIYKPYEKSNDGKFGLGMSIVKRTLDMFNIRIEINNLENGVEFLLFK